MFLIAGVQPRTRQGPKMDQPCPHCGLNQVYARRVDHCFSLFFIPLIRVKKGERFAWCERCQTPVARSVDPTAAGPRSESDGLQCRGCAAALSPEFRYCPYCGRPRR